MFLEQEIKLPGRAESRLAATKPCRLQLDCQGDQLSTDKFTTLILQQSDVVVCGLVIYDTVQTGGCSPKEAGTHRVNIHQK
jgi:hypothetical protein